MGVRGDLSLYDLAEAIVHAYSFDFGHAFGFFNRTGEDYLHSLSTSIRCVQESISRITRVCMHIEVQNVRRTNFRKISGQDPE
jgi:hypothetical protein